MLNTITAARRNFRRPSGALFIQTYTSAGITQTTAYFCHLLLAAFLVGGEIASAQSVPVAIAATDTIFDAGRSAPTLGGTIPYSIPLPVGINRFLAIVGTSDGVRMAPTDPYNGADGAIGGYWSSGTDVLSFNGVSGIVFSNRVLFVVGVFLDDTLPIAPAPSRLSYAAVDTTAIQYPSLRQTFFLGNGTTDAGLSQRIYVPANATRICLGFADGNRW